MKNVKKTIEEILEREVRPRLAIHAGNIEFVDFDEVTGCVSVRLLGMCHGCPLASLTLQHGIEALLKERIKTVVSVVAVV
ncbi:hypothetical protein A3C17_04110 [Candidatus Uhrbacteria bacterium RIFCSPHIGHO2_02_FULL_53_13]|uniref:NIF system FeS cluster assembly NifU C-terminal domain-containing protein n=2 Tax=Candidatus Uhriibacteriota TaxID=1752732 RepID=A0A1F7TXL5_9BACT|nr:MAG: hypothetical protein A3C17_04110 [Candidatus Uhrbacteria bacterium RIFCSPHIGHO2_02_FULL_53_13]OGL89894.1 MAG: hypothetical protein A3I45_00795 [Candidatus Uhrbacteria bacterium RIFCSPLOWO2_02_FULL_53_10]